MPKGGIVIHFEESQSGRANENGMAAVKEAKPRSAAPWSARAWFV